MTALARPPIAPIKKVFHPSDLTAASESAFRHALKVAQVAQAELTVLHVAQQDVAGWAEFPGVRQWLHCLAETNRSMPDPLTNNGEWKMENGKFEVL